LCQERCMLKLYTNKILACIDFLTLNTFPMPLKIIQDRDRKPKTLM